MTLLDFYKLKNEDRIWFSDYFSLAKNKHGRMFEYTTTNFRTQSSFITQFNEFLFVENTVREAWARQEDHGQESDKHRVVNMIQSKLFKKEVSGLYTRTAKGSLYSNFIKLEMGEEEKWLINYIFLLNGYYTNRKNYIVNRVRDDILSILSTVDGLSVERILSEAKKVLHLTKFDEIVRTDFFYIHSFYHDPDFLIRFFRSSEQEKKELAEYIEENRGENEEKSCLSKKYRTGGNFTPSSFVDETKVFLLTTLFIKSNRDESNLLEFFVETFNTISNVDRDIVYKYIKQNSQIFEPIFSDILDVDYFQEVDSQVYTTETEVEEDRPEPFLDETSEFGKQQIKSVFRQRKRQARILGGYKCALEKFNNCSAIYFTAKINNQNYLELHHFIPQEFRNDFTYSIEVLANYVTLCPRCHRQIHLALDRERKPLINALYEDRSARLAIVGLELKREEIYSYYKIDE